MARSLVYDQAPVKELRMEVIYACLEVIHDSPKVKKWSKYKKEMILRMSPRVLPVVNEHSEPEGKPIPILNILGQNENKGTDSRI